MERSEKLPWIRLRGLQASTSHTSGFVRFGLLAVFDVFQLLHSLEAGKHPRQLVQPTTMLDVA